MMMEKNIGVAPTTAVPINTGLAAALNVLPAPSLASSRCLARSKSTPMLKSFLISACTFGTASIRDSSYTDCALSVTGPYESTAMVTGPMPRNPNATKPNANTAGASMSDAKPCVLIQAPVAINANIAMPNQNALKLPATKPERIFSDAPPSSDEVTTSRTCRECTDVKAFTNSGIIAPASVPHVITEACFQHKVVSPPRLGMIWLKPSHFGANQIADFSHASEVSGAS